VVVKAVDGMRVGIGVPEDGAYVGIAVGSAVGSSVGDPAKVLIA